ncbi:MAG: hypothetical protein AABW47_03280 [Nanoarchaeota archaeon]
MINKSEEKPRSKSELEKQIMKEYIEEVVEIAEELGINVAKSVVYPIETAFAFPTIFCKARDYDDNAPRLGYGNLAKGWTIAGGILGSIGMYTTLALTNPKLILPIALTQVGTNLASGYYEWKKSIKERARF